MIHVLHVKDTNALYAQIMQSCETLTENENLTSQELPKKNF